MSRGCCAPSPVWWTAAKPEACVSSSSTITCRPMPGCRSRCSCTVVLATRQRNRQWTRTQLFTEPVQAGAAGGIAAGSVDYRLSGETFRPAQLHGCRLPYGACPIPQPVWESCHLRGGRLGTCSAVRDQMPGDLWSQFWSQLLRTVATVVTTTAVGGGSPDRARDPDRTFLGPDAVVAQPASPAACVSANRVWQRRGIAVGDRGGACLGQPRSWGVRLGMGNPLDDPARRRWPHSDPA
jgi:hypothetical protein